jgi:hypothetical protein
MNATHRSVLLAISKALRDLGRELERLAGDGEPIPVGPKRRKAAPDDAEPRPPTARQVEWLRAIREVEPGRVDQVARAFYGGEYRSKLNGPAARALAGVVNRGLAENNDGFYRTTEAGWAAAL